MMSGGSTWLPTDGIEPVEIQLFQLTGYELIGSTDIAVQVRRQQDGYYFDWPNKEFRISAQVSEFYQTLYEVSPSKSPGLYRLNTPDHPGGFNTAIIVNPGVDDIYDVTVKTRSGTNYLYGLPTGFEIKMGWLADKIIGLPGNVADAVWNAIHADHTVTGSFGDLMRRVVALQKENYFIDNTTYNTQGLLLEGRIRLFATKAEVNAATKGGSSEGEFATYTLVTTPQTLKPERAEVVRSVRDS
jgi:hypothetical protein